MRYTRSKGKWHRGLNGQDWDKGIKSDDGRRGATITWDDSGAMGTDRSEVNIHEVQLEEKVHAVIANVIGSPCKEHQTGTGTAQRVD